MRLSPASLDRLPPEIERFHYDRMNQLTGIVHFGIGAFCRAHLAWYTDGCMNDGERDWAIAGVSLRSDAVARQLNPQGGLYTLVERSGVSARARVIGSVRDVLVGQRNKADIVERLAARRCRIASFTVTEKGYCRADDGSLDPTLARAGFYRPLAKALRERMKAGLPGLTLINCDNLPHNGALLRQLLLEYCAAEEHGLSDWVAEKCSFPSTMVDRIVPATTGTDLAKVSAMLGGIEDEAAVFTERFSQWVIEDRFAGERPGWDRHGAQLVADVAPYETAKLRMLNGAHSLLAYCGLERGHEFVHEAIADPGLRVLTDRLMRDEAATSFAPARGQDLTAYANALIKRFADPALQHRLIQIAMDGSQKIPQRWLATLAHHRREGRQCPAILEGLAAWLRHVRGDLHPVNDPLGERLAKLWRGEGARGIGPALFGANGLFAMHWQASDDDLATIEKALGEDR